MGASPPCADCGQQPCNCLNPGAPANIDPKSARKAPPASCGCWPFHEPYCDEMTGPVEETIPAPAPGSSYIGYTCTRCGGGHLGIYCIGEDY